jgi:hypothetical protein
VTDDVTNDVSTGTSAFLRPWERSREALAEFESFDWPLRTVVEVHRLLATRHITPTWLLLGECDGAWGEVAERTRGVITLAVDRNVPSTRCISYQGEFQDVLHLCIWDCICAWPSCTHHAISNSPGMRAAKERDGRMFWGLVGLLYVLYAGTASARVVEQPKILKKHLPPFVPPGVNLVTSSFGDRSRKTIQLFLVDVSLSAIDTYRRQPLQTELARAPHWTFASAEERSRYRSSWTHYPLFMLMLARVLLFTPSVATPLSFSEVVEAFAVLWYEGGLPVPDDYDNPSGLPLDADAGEYQQVHGEGDGRQIVGVVPHSLRTAEPLHEPPVADELDAMAAERFILLAALTAQGFALFFFTTLLQPLVYAPLSGLHVLGAELPIEILPKQSALRIMSSWAASAWGSTAVAHTFMVGRYLLDGAGYRVGVTALPFVPAAHDIVRTPRRRIQLHATGRTAAWCTLAALAGTAVYDPAARVFASMSAFARPVTHLADALTADERARPTFTFGAMRAVSLVRAPQFSMQDSPMSFLLEKDAYNSVLLRTGIHELLEQQEYAYLEGWAERIGPPQVDLHEGLASLLPDFSDSALLHYAFTPPYVPPRTTPSPRMPAQLPRATPRCIRSVVELLDEGAQRRLHDWLGKVLDQLRCIELLRTAKAPSHRHRPEWTAALGARSRVGLHL